MAMVKVSVTLDKRLVAQAKKRAGSIGLSSYMNEALRLHLQRDKIDELIEEYERTHGTITEEEMEKAAEPWRELERRRARKAR